MENEIVNGDTPNAEEIVTQDVVAEVSGLDAAALQAKVAELGDKNKQLFARAKTAEGFTLKDGHWVKAAKPAPTPPKEEQPTATGEVEDTTQLLLEVKGITTDDDVALFQKWKTDTNRKPREILNNSIFQAELAALRAEKATQAAMPSSNGRSGASGPQNLDALVEKFNRTGELPKDFETKAKVIGIAGAKESSKTPPWRR